MEPRPQTREVPVREAAIAEAAILFGRVGYAAASMRDIAAAIGVSAPALYHHFASKADLYCAAHQRGMDEISAAVCRAVAEETEPWSRLRAFASTHCEALIGDPIHRALITPLTPDLPKEMRSRLITLRDAYEKRLADVVAELDLPEDVDPVLFRLHFLGALNWATTWYNPGGRFTPAGIGRDVVDHLKRSLAK